MTDATCTPRAELVKAMCKVALAVGKIAKNERNQHGRYDFAGIDAFLEVVGPAMAENGLVPLLELIGTEIVERVNSFDKRTFYERSRWSMTILHESGEVYGPIHREIECVLTAAQTCGISQSYALKACYRAAFNIVTGEPDADAQPAEQPTERRAVTSRQDVEHRQDVEQRFKSALGFLRSADSIGDAVRLRLDDLRKDLRPEQLSELDRALSDAEDRIAAAAAPDATPHGGEQ